MRMRGVLFLESLVCNNRSLPLDFFLFPIRCIYTHVWLVSSSCVSGDFWKTNKNNNKNSTEFTLGPSVKLSFFRVYVCLNRL